MATMRANELALRLSRLGRLSKSLLVAGASTLMALLSHVAVGGAVPEAQGVLVPFALAAVVCLPLSGRLRSLPRLIPAVILSQLLYHWLFVLGAPTDATLAAIGGSGAHAGHAFVLLGGDAAASADALMWAAHAGAALATILLIRRGETAVVALVRLVRLVAAAILPALPADTPLATAPRSAGPTSRPHGIPLLELLDASTSRRGPPRRLEPVLR